MQPDDPTGPSLEKELAEEERRRNQGGTGDTTSSACDGCDAISCDAISCDTPSCDTPNCDLPGCDGCDGCNLLVFVRLSSLLLVAAAVVPETGGRRLLRVLLRGYRRWLTSFTPDCPATPSCSAYAVAAVESLGARRGLVATAHRIRSCGTRAGC